MHHVVPDLRDEGVLGLLEGEGALAGAVAHGDVGVEAPAGGTVEIKGGA